MDSFKKLSFPLPFVHAACDCLCQFRITGGRRQMTSSDQLTECRSTLRHRKHRDSSCPANCMLHPSASTEMPVVVAKTSNKKSSTANSNIFSSLKRPTHPKIPQSEPDIQICNPAISNSQNGKRQFVPLGSHTAYHDLKLSVKIYQNKIYRKVL